MTKDEIKKLIQEVIAEGIEADIPDEEIARVTRAETAELERRVAALESESTKRGVAASAPTVKPARVDVLRAAQEQIAKRGRKAA